MQHAASDTGEPASPGDSLLLMQLAADYWLRADAIDPRPAGALFMDNGTLVLGSLQLETRPAIDSFFLERARANLASGRTTRHFAANFAITMREPDRALVRSTVLVFAGSGSLPIPCSGPSGIADFEDVCVRGSAGRWLFEKRVGRTVFIGEGAPSFAR